MKFYVLLFFLISTQAFPIIPDGPFLTEKMEVILRYGLQDPEDVEGLKYLLSEYEFAATRSDVIEAFGRSVNTSLAGDPKWISVLEKLRWDLDFQMSTKPFHRLKLYNFFSQLEFTVYDGSFIASDI